MAAVRWTLGAQEDLQGIVEYIGQDSPSFAAATAARIVSAVRKLRKHPRLGRMVPEYDDPAIRELIVLNYRMVYHLTRGRVAILAIVHGSRDMLKRLGPSPWML